MTTAANAKKLYAEYNNEYRFYSAKQRGGFLNRCRNLGKKIHETETEAVAIMCLDNIATRIGKDIFNDK